MVMTYIVYLKKIYIALMQQSIKYQENETQSQEKTQLIV